VPVVFKAYYQQYGSYRNAYGSETVLVVDGVSYSGATAGNGITFYWDVGSTHSVTWYSSVYRDESSYYTGQDTRYDWSCSTGIFTSMSGSLTVPSSGGTVTAYYLRYIAIAFGGYSGVYPSGSGSVSPSSSGWYPEGQQITASANSGYQFNHWLIQQNSEWTSVSNPFTMSDPGYLAAIFYIRFSVWVVDSDGYSVSGASVYLYTLSSTLYASGSTDSSGTITFTVESNTYYLAVLQTTSVFGYTTHFYKWWDGSTNPVRQITIDSPVTRIAYYNTPLVFANLNSGYGTNWLGTTVGYWADGYVKSVHGSAKSGVTVQADFNPNISGVTCGSGTATTDSNGYFKVDVYIGGVVSGLYRVRYTTTSVPEGYEPITVTIDRSP